MQKITLTPGQWTEVQARSLFQVVGQKSIRIAVGSYPPAVDHRPTSPEGAQAVANGEALHRYRQDAHPEGMGGRDRIVDLHNPQSAYLWLDYGAGRDEAAAASH